MQLENSCPTNSGGLNPLFTVGHSILEFEHFAKLLKDFGVELVVDVRSLPQSARLPHFSQPAFEKLLGAEHISYLFLGEELGGRDRKSTRLNSSHRRLSRMPSSA